MHIQKIILFVFYFVILTAVAGCESISLPVPSQQVISSNNYLHIERECSPTSSPSLSYTCEFLITTGPFDEAKTVDIKLHADYGVNFSDDVNFQNILSESNRTSTVKGLHLQPQGTRIIHFPFTYDPQTVLAGEYMVTIQLMEKRDGVDVLIDEAEDKVFIHREYSDDHIKHLNLIQEQSDFNATYVHPYATGDNVTYRVLPDSESHPTAGDVFIKVMALHDNYDPVLTIHSEGGIEFQPIDAISICVNKGGSRIIRFPFRIIKNADQANGRYTLSLTIQEDGTTLTHEILSTAIELLSEANTHQGQWLKTSTVASLHVATPAISYAAGIGGLNNTKPDNLSTGYSQTVSTNNHISSGNQEQIFANGGKPGHCDVSTSPTPTPPNKINLNDNDMRVLDTTRIGGNPFADNDQNAGGGIGDIKHPDVNAAQSLTDSAAWKKPDDPRCTNWIYSAPVNGHNITLGEIYQQFIAEEVLEMESDRFVSEFRLCNGVNAEEDVVIVDAGNPYYLPIQIETAYKK